jgi:hypothetical protein
MDNTDPIIQTVEQFIAAIPTADYERKPLLLALMNWFQSQDVPRDELCSALATLLGMFIGARAKNEKHMRKGLSIYAEKVRGTAEMVMECKDGCRS